MTTSYEIRPIGHVESSLVDRESAPKQRLEGAPDASLVFEPEVSEGLRDLAVGDEVFAWIHRCGDALRRLGCGKGLLAWEDGGWERGQQSRAVRTVWMRSSQVGCAARQ